MPTTTLTYTCLCAPTHTPPPLLSPYMSCLWSWGQPLPSTQHPNPLSLFKGILAATVSLSCITVFSLSTDHFQQHTNMLLFPSGLKICLLTSLTPVKTKSNLVPPAQKSLNGSHLTQKDQNPTETSLARSHLLLPPPCLSQTGVFILPSTHSGVLPLGLCTCCSLYCVLSLRISEYAFSHFSPLGKYVIFSVRLSLASLCEITLQPHLRYSLSLPCFIFLLGT